MAAPLGRDFTDAPMRPKTWDECDDKEKMERLRSELQGLREGQSRLAETTYHTANTFREHSHDNQGRAVVPANHGQPMGMGGHHRFDPLA